MLHSIYGHMYKVSTIADVWLPTAHAVDRVTAWRWGLSSMGRLLRQVVMDGLRLSSQEPLTAAGKREETVNTMPLRTVDSRLAHIDSNLFCSGSDRDGWVVLRAPRRWCWEISLAPGKSPLPLVTPCDGRTENAMHVCPSPDPDLFPP